MSQLIDTSLGQFRVVADGEQKRFLFECPCCGEMLPMSEGHLNGTALIDHESRKEPARFCTFQGTRDFGRQLIATMRSHILMGYLPYHEEGRDHAPSGGGVDGPI